MFNTAQRWLRILSSFSRVAGDEGEPALVRAVAEPHGLRAAAEAGGDGHVGVTQSAVTAPVRQISRDARLYVRLRREDHLLLRERANGRGLAAATYASMLLRAHLRAMNPLPERELTELKRAVAARGLIGRSLNQVAWVAHQSGTAGGPSAGDMRAILRALEGLREHVKALMLANARAWEGEHVEAHG